MGFTPSDEERHDPSVPQLAAGTVGFLALLAGAGLGMAATVGDIDPGDRTQAWLIVGIVFLLSFSLTVRALWNRPFARKSATSSNNRQNITVVAGAVAVGGGYLLARGSPWAEVVVIPIPAGLVGALFVRFAKALVTKLRANQGERTDLY
jgi:cobalamin synthase